MNEFDLQKALYDTAFEKADALYALLTRIYPRDEAYVENIQEQLDLEQNEDRRKELKTALRDATQLQNLIDTAQDEESRHKFATISNYLKKYSLNEEIKPSRRWSGQIHFMNQLAKYFVDENKSAPKDHIALMDFLVKELDNDLKGVFSKSASKKEVTYETIFERVSKRYTEKGVRPPSSAHQKHNLTYGDLQEANEWLRTGDSRDFAQAFPEKFFFYAENFQIQVLERMIKEINDNPLKPNDYIDTLLARTYQRLREHDQTRFEKAHFLPAIFLQQGISSEESFRTSNHYNMARMLNWSVSMLIGIDSIFSDENLDAKFDHETYRKVRNFLAHEYDSVLDLNRSAALMTLIFPKYEDFTNYILKKSAYNPDTQSLDLHTLIDISRFNFEDMDYSSWGSAFFEKGPSINFYIKAAHLLKNISKNDKGALLIGDIDLQLYHRITDVVSLCKPDDIAKYSDLKLVRDVDAIQKFVEKCKEATKDKTLPDRPYSLPPLEINGEDFGMPGYRFGLLDYDSPYFPIIGRFTDSCERADGDWEDELFNAYVHRKAGVFCLFDPEGKPVAHTLIERQHKDLSILYKGFEAQSSITKEMLENLVAEIRKQNSHETFTVGTSSLRLNFEEKRTVSREELQPGHKVKADLSRAFDAGRTVEETPVAPIKVIRDDSGLLDKLSGDLATEPKGP